LSETDSDWGWFIGDEVLKVSSGNVGIHELEEAIGIGFLGKSDGDWGWFIGDEVLEVSSGDVGVHKLEKTISIRFLGKSDSDWGWFIGDEVLEVSSGDVSVHKFEKTIGIGFLGKSNGDWGWFVSDEVLEVSSGDVSVHKLEKTIGIGFLGKSNGDWGWFVSNQVLEVSSGDVSVHKLEKSIGIGFHLIELKESLGDWCIGILDESNKGLLGDVFTVKFTNVNWGLGLLLGPFWSLILNGIISIIIRETFIDDLRESFTSIEDISSWWNVSFFWVSLNHNSHGDVVVIGHIFGLLSGSVKDRVEGIITNNLSEALKSNRLDGIKVVQGVNLEFNGLNFINWDINESWVGSGGTVINFNEVGSSWGFWNLGDELWSILLVVLLVMALMVGFTVLFKVRFLTLIDFLLLGNKGLNGGVDHVLDLAL